MGDKIHRNALKPGHKLHWYRIEKVLGQGGFGITYLAYDFNLDRMAAIKEYLPSELAMREGDFSVHPLSDDHGKQYHWGLDRFLKEARTLAKFEHPNIIRVLNVFEANNTAYMVMSYVEGESLQEILTRRKTLEEKELLNILIPVLDGLEKVHKAGFIHRDIKPANIYLREDGSPVLLDFGSARQALGEHNKTLTSLVTPGYAPFEQYHSKSEAQGPWTDIYSLGATLYRAVSGKSPLDAVDRSLTILKGGRDMFVSAAEIGRGRYSERFLRAIDHALQFREEDRPQTIAEWIRELEQAEEHAPEMQITERATGVVQQAPRVIGAGPKASVKIPARSAFRRAKTWLALLLFAVVIGGAIWLYRMAPPADLDTPAKTEMEALQPEAARTPRNAPERSGQIATLLSEAKADFDAMRLIQPENNNALQGYRKVLELDPQNAVAQQGLSNIADQLVALAQHASAANDFAQAGKYLDAASDITPDAPNIQLTRNELQMRKAAQERIEAEARIVLQEAEAAANKGDAPATLSRIEQARKLGVDDTALAAVQEKLRTRLGQIERQKMEQAEAKRKAAEEMQRQEDEEAKRLAAEEAKKKDEARLPGSVFQDTQKDGTKGPEMVVIPAGSFQMGDLIGDGESNEKPVHTVTIARPFALGKYEVTFEEYDKFARATGRQLPGDEGWGRGNMPVINVNWNDAAAYIAWLSGQTGKRYRLPSEAEWEYAARAGTTTSHWWGNKANKEHAKFGSLVGGPVTVGKFPANAFGLHDTAGNVWEWIQDCWNGNYNGAPADGTAWQTGDCSQRMLRGGSWGYNPNWIRSAYRYGYFPTKRFSYLGFRLAQDL